MKRRFLLSLVAAAGAAAVLACSGGFPAEFPAPEFTLKSPRTGKETAFASVKGKPVIIYWFTSW